MLTFNTINSAANIFAFPRYLCSKTRKISSILNKVLKNYVQREKPE